MGGAKQMTATKGPETAAPVLRRTLTTWGAISLSIAAMGASLAVNINPQGPAPPSAGPSR